MDLTQVFDRYAVDVKRYLVSRAACEATATVGLPWRGRGSVKDCPGSDGGICYCLDTLSR